MSYISVKLSHPLRFDERKDLQRVESGQSTSITEALRTGIVKSSAILDDSNGIEDPSAVLGVVRDKFEAIDAERAIRKYGKKAQKPAGLAQGVPSPAPAAPAAPAASSAPSA